MHGAEFVKDEGLTLIPCAALAKEDWFPQGKVYDERNHPNEGGEKEESYPASHKIQNSLSYFPHAIFFHGYYFTSR